LPVCCRTFVTLENVIQMREAPRSVALRWHRYVALLPAGLDNLCILGVGLRLRLGLRLTAPLKIRHYGDPNSFPGANRLSNVLMFMTLQLNEINILYSDVD
jgi:hypothetical protein